MGQTFNVGEMDVFKMNDDDDEDRYGDRNSISVEAVSRFQHLFPNLQLVDARKGIWSPKSRSRTHG